MQYRDDQDIEKKERKASILDLSLIMAEHLGDPDFEQKLQKVMGIWKNEVPSCENPIETDVPEISHEEEPVIEDVVPILPSENEEASSEEPPVKEKRQKTVAAQVCDAVRPKVPGMKRKIDAEGEDVGSSKTPIKVKKQKTNKDTTKIIFSPQGTTLEVVQTTHRFFKKVSGQGFVVPQNQEKNQEENKENTPGK